MGPTYLDAIVERHRRAALADTRDWHARLSDPPYHGPSFHDALCDDSSVVAVIAEVKRRSPSKGWLDERLDVVATCASYERGGARAISVLTDEDFAGTLGDLRAARAATSLPLLRKDFTVSENDLLDARDAGASAVLLIVAVLSDASLRALLELAGAVGLDALVEVHDADEARRALDAGATIVGVNQRDLHTFGVDPERAATVVKVLPSDCARVCESGLSSRSDVERAAAVGFDAVLVGEAFIRDGEREHLVASFGSVSRPS